MLFLKKPGKIYFKSYQTLDTLSADTFRFSLQPDINVRYLQDAYIESIITTTTDGATLRCTNRDRK